MLKFNNSEVIFIISIQLEKNRLHFFQATEMFCEILNDKSGLFFLHTEIITDIII